MSGQDTTTLSGAQHARDELRERCLALVRRWQPLAQGGWDQIAARKLGEEIDQIADTGERLGLEDVSGSALELAAYLCSFVDDGLAPNAKALGKLAEMVNRLGAVLTDLSATETAAVHALPGARAPVEPVPSPAAAEPEPPAHAETGTPASAAVASEDPAEPSTRPTHLPRAVCLIGIAAATVPGLAEGLRERGYDVREFDEAPALLDFLAHAIPGALLVDARKLRVMARVAVQYAGMGLTGERMPAVLAVSPDGDLGHRLLAMRAGAAALFSAPVDSLRVIGKLDELLHTDAQPEWRVLLAESDRAHATESARALVERGMTARLVGNGQAALAAIGDFRPDVIVIDHDLPDVSGVELIQLIRQQNEFAAVPIILAVDASGTAQRFDAIAAGGDEVLLKPVKARHLIGAVQARVQRAHWLREIIGKPGGRDARTGLYSRTILIEKLEAALGDRSAALLYIALDRAALLREQIGLAGLAALDAHVGNLLRSQLDELDLSAQYQDFHYFTLLNRRSRRELTAAAENIREALGEQAWQFNGRTHALSASLGLALLGGENASVDSVVTNAQAAQLAAAHMGGNRVLWFEAKEAALLPIDPLLAVRAVLSRPLAPEQTQFEFCAIAPLAGKLHGQYELGFKVRSVQHPGTSVSYQELAPVAVECSQIAALDRMLLQHSLEVREEQLRRGRQVRLFVPQAVSSALESEFGWWLERELKSRHLSGTGLTIELACSTLIDAGERAREQVKVLHQHGVRFCLVDYGRDWAAVHALKNLNVDFVRLAPALVAELGSAKAVSDTLLALVRKAHAGGVAVIAPEVDSLQRAHLLLRLGVDYGIGPAFSRPQPQPDFDFNRPLW
ncbi:MAG: EAL domain-containing protein [Xanthomonadaceae bacterium]|nr:EAL domain-containing protein [Xanthomonadaceae bacterium]MDE1961810.1 EAL domain-containing protein [Xanthomonadaceae bacterium]MDE2084267.1 EAL domain-containing protein [Xanthomonadaceae bacterium]MDE2256834.1 EAL domain-containing protein [Xanthomonadaceae bacterium]